jgi:hypothetical protein
LQITLLLFTKPRSRATPGGGVSAPFTTKVHGTTCGGKAARTRGRSVK